MTKKAYSMKRYLRPILVCGLTQIFMNSLAAMNSDLPTADGETRVFALLLSNIVENYDSSHRPPSITEASDTNPLNNTQSSNTASESRSTQEPLSPTRQIATVAPTDTQPIVAQTEEQTPPTEVLTNLPDPSIPRTSIITLGEGLSPAHLHYLTRALGATQPTADIRNNGAQSAANKAECLVQ